MKIVVKAFLRYLFRRRSLSVLQLLSIACGVAAVVGMTLSAKSALSSFNRAVEFIRGKSTHLIERPAGKMEENIIMEIMNDVSVDYFAPVIDKKVRLDDGVPVRVLGIDPFLDHRVRPEMKTSSGRLNHDFILDEKSVFIDTNLSSKLKLAAGDTLKTSKGDLKVADIFLNPSGEPIILIDIGHAQKLFDMYGYIDRIDLVLNDEAMFRSKHGTGFKVESNRQRRENFTALLRAFRLNLQASSLLALFVGVFLIYNTAMFTVVSRRKDAGIMRSLGARRHEIIGAFLSEILLFGIIGGALGGVIGYILSRFLTGLVGNTISNLYFVMHSSPASWSWWNVANGIALGCCASTLGSISPLLELVRTEPVKMIRGRIYHRTSTVAVKKISLIGAGVLLLSALTLAFSFLHVYIGFAGTFIFLLGVSLLSGLVLMFSVPLIKKLFSSICGATGRIVAGNIWLNTNRTSVAIAAFMIALSMSIGLGSLIDSFRNSLVWWMNSQLRGDIYISTRGDVDVPLDFYEELRKMPGVAGIDVYRNIQTDYNDTPVHITAIDASVLQKFTRFEWINGGDENWDPVKKGSAIISESFARRFNIGEGRQISIESASGPVSLPVTGIFYDYSSEHGVIMMDRSTFIKLFNDHTINSLGIFIDASDRERQKIVIDIEKRAEARGLPSARREDFHGRILSVFDDTFAVTRSMRILATIIAFFGIAGALMTLFVERQKEFGIYRALGFSTNQVANITLMEGIGMGIISLFMSIFSGTILSVILIKVINLRSFNWTVFYHFSMSPYFVAFLTAVLASIGASIYPIWKVYRTYPQMQIREE